MRRSIRLVAAAVLATLAHLSAAHAEDPCDQLRGAIQKTRCKAAREDRVPPEDLARAEAGATHIDWVYDLALSPDGALLASAGRDQTVKLWEVASGKFLRNLGKHDGFVRKIVFSPDGKKVYSLADNQGLSELDAGSGKLDRVERGPADKWYDMSISRDGKLLALREDHAIVLWQIADWKERSRLPDSAQVVTMRFAPNSTALLGIDSGGAKLWDPETTKATLLAPLKGIDAVAYSPDGSLIGWAGDKKAGLWEAAAGKLVRDWPSLNPYATFSIALTPDNALMLIGHQYPTVWEVATGTLVRKLGDLEDLTHAIVITRDGKLAITAHMGSDIRVWDIASGNLVRRFGERVN